MTLFAVEAGDFDERLRSAALAFLRTVQLRTGGPVRYDDVASFEFDGRRVPLMDPQRGIRKPRGLDAALSSGPSSRRGQTSARTPTSEGSTATSVTSGVGPTRIIPRMWLYVER